MDGLVQKLNPHRIGFHYFPDSAHYRDSDLRAWVPEHQALGAYWLVLKTPLSRAIPEPFIDGLVKAGVEPILHFQISPTRPPAAEEMAVLFESYAQWGVRFAILFDRPNRRRTWTERDWAQSELVERFIDAFLPLAEVALESGLRPVFPPLEPGGDYWDTAFLRSALQSVKRRGSHTLTHTMALSAYAWPDNLPLNWGAGGPERWPGARPYATEEGEEDQRGFRIFDWYLAVSQAVLGFKPDIHLVGTGLQIGAHRDVSHEPVDEDTHTKQNLALLQQLMDTRAAVSEEADYDPIPKEVLSANIWLLSAGVESAHESQAWYKPDGQRMEVVEEQKLFVAEGDLPPSGEHGDAFHSKGRRAVRPIAHYLLLPSYEWGIADWHIEEARDYIKRFRPTIGFSLVEASQASMVTVMGDDEQFSEEILDELRSAGCVVERISLNGTTIASMEAEV